MNAKLISVAAICAMPWTAAYADTEKYRADLSGSKAVPANESNGKATAEFSFEPGTKVISWIVTVSGLSGKPTAAHLHGPANEDQTAGPIVTLTNPATRMEGTSTLTGDQAEALTQGKIYINIHTDKFPDGEIRGQLHPER